MNALGRELLVEGPDVGPMRTLGNELSIRFANVMREATLDPRAFCVIDSRLQAGFLPNQPRAGLHLAGIAADSKGRRNVGL